MKEGRRPLKEAGIIGKEVKGGSRYLRDGYTVERSYCREADALGKEASQGRRYNREGGERGKQVYQG